MDRKAIRETIHAAVTTFGHEGLQCYLRHDRMPSGLDLNKPDDAVFTVEVDGLRRSSREADAEQQILTNNRAGYCVCGSSRAPHSSTCPFERLTRRTDARLIEALIKRTLTDRVNSVRAEEKFIPRDRAWYVTLHMMNDVVGYYPSERELTVTFFLYLNGRVQAA